ncbi:MAG TPA: LPS export ABC transporter ATP-binding protein [Gemmatimonadaceae bacterium]|nr:LPS export ABC transporter ATP-binding protein [Gemmatimonadaceae bacterium]
MSDFQLPPEVERFIDQKARGDRSTALALHSLVCVARDGGEVVFNDAAIHYRNDHLEMVRQEGGDSEREAGRLSLDEVRAHLAKAVFPRFVDEGMIILPPGGLDSPDGVIRIADRYWKALEPFRAAMRRTEMSDVLRYTGEHAAVRKGGDGGAPKPAAAGSVLEAVGLLKTYRRRSVVNDVALRLQQGEIVGLLGPNGAGKTTTFYMIVGLIQPQEGRILLDNQDITEMPMYRRARLGIGYLSQEPSIFRKLTVAENILAILETMKLSAEERQQRLDRLLDELSIKHLRDSKAYSLSGGERRRLEITRALVTEPKFMMLDEPFAGVDPIAVHDIQSIVAGLRHRGIGVLISDHNVEQTLDIVDRAYIMFDGQVKVSGTVRELVFDDTVARIYLGPTLAARLRARFARVDQGESDSTPGDVS